MTDPTTPDGTDQAANSPARPRRDATLARRAESAATQVRNPWRTTARTFVQLLPLIAAIIPAMIDAIQNTAPEWLAGWGPAALAASLIITRIMQTPQVDRLLSAIGLGAEPANSAGPPGNLER